MLLELRFEVRKVALRKLAWEWRSRFLPEPVTLREVCAAAHQLGLKEHYFLSKRFYGCMSEIYAVSP
jgi:hypothetical protein